MSESVEFDYIIIGAGSAGAVLANRLSQNEKTRVLLLEAGPEDKGMWLKIPAGMSRVFMPSPINWGYFTEPEPHLDGRKIYWPRGKTLGGSSSINGMVYLRGHPDDYNGWAQLGNQGWAWDDVLPYFRRHEDNSRGADENHGIGGEMAVADPVVDDKAGRLFIESAQSIGTPYRADLNDGVQHGVSRAQVTIKKHRRESTATAFLNPVKSRPNLVIACSAMAERLLFEGKRVVGVSYRQGEETKQARAKNEVILSGGVVNSPQLLMLSGIGPAAQLKSYGVDVVCDLSGVGQNLQDHAYVYYTPRVDRDISANHKITGLRAVWEAFKYFTAGKGYLNMGAVQATAFPIVGPGATRPDVEISFRPFSIGANAAGVPIIHDFPALNASCSLLRPQARGRIELAGNDPRIYPRIFANYLDNDTDMIVMREGMRWIRNCFAAKPMADYVTSEEAPGMNCQSDKDWETYIRATAQTVYHPVGTCKMGVSEDAVVDPSLKVRGIAGLRVVDASVMPIITSSNTNGPTIMIADKASDMILADARTHH